MYNTGHKIAHRDAPTSVGSTPRRRCSVSEDYTLFDSERLCLGCKRLLPLSMFNRGNRWRDGLKPRCKKCQSDEHKRKKLQRHARHTEDYYQRLLSEPSAGKVCPDCKEFKPWKAYYRNRSTVDGFGFWCRFCASFRAARHTKGYKLTGPEFRELLERQGGLCAICRRPPDGTRLVVDHDHTGGDVRGLLCHGCNRGIGLMREDPAALRRAADYLEGA